MALKLMYITNNPAVAQIAEDAGVDRIFVDMEYIGKSDRQGGMDTVQSHHSIQDIRNVKAVINKAELMVRLNPVHEAAAEYGSTAEEVDAAIEAGAQILMLPYFKTLEEIRVFLNAVAGRVRTILLVETPEAVEIIDEILELPGIDEVYVGLNDLSLGYGYNFMFRPLADGTVEKLSEKFLRKGLPFGFGGVASLGKGMLPSECVIREHYRLGSSCTILSRSFCDLHKITDLNQVRTIFAKGVQDIRNLEQECRLQAQNSGYFADNQRVVVDRVCAICACLPERK